MNSDKANILEGLRINRPAAPERSGRGWLRTVLTMLSVFVVSVLFGFLCALKAAFTGGVSLAGRTALDRFGWKVGDRVPLIFPCGPDAHCRRTAGDMRTRA